MRNILYLILRFSAFFTFLLLELVSFYLIINFNKSQGEIWSHSTQQFTGAINNRVQVIDDFVSLRAVNDSLTRENAALLQTIINYRIYDEDNAFQEFEVLPESDSTIQYKLIPANVVSKTLHLRNNFLTIDKGLDDGIAMGMGVISKSGVIGIVKSASEKYATIMMIQNSQSRISCMVGENEFIGNLIWQSSDVKTMSLLDVPKHADIKIGDKVITSGYSISFPKHISIGKVVAFDIMGGSNSYTIQVELDYDLSNVNYAYVVEFLNSEEKDKLLSSQDE